MAPTITPAPTNLPTTTATPTSELSPPSCTLCLHGNDKLHVNQSKPFSIPGLLAQTCGELLQTAALFPRNSPVCTSIRTLGFYCGCPSPRNVCTLCRSGQLPLYAQGDSIHAAASQYNIFGAPAGTNLDCGTLDSAIRILAKKNDTLCQQTQLRYGTCCGLATAGNPYNSTTSPFPNPLPSFQPCKICMDGSSITYPNRTIQLGALPVRNCSQLEILSNIFHANDTQCTNIELLGPYCGCPITQRACSFCPNGEPVPFPNRPFPLLKNFQGLPQGFLREVASDLTCGEFQSILDIDPHSGIGIDPGYACLVGQFRSAECGCSQGRQEILVTWLFRASSILSLIGSFFIIRDLLRKPAARRTTYHQLILGTTCFDVITSIAYLLSGLLMPPPAYEAYGTHATCVLQGVLIQLCLTSLFYSVLLSIYYLLLIKYNWKESQFLKYRRYFNIPIIAVGIALTGAAGTSIAPQLGFCYIAIPPEATNRIRITLLFVVPASAALAIIIGCTALICYHVYSKEKTTLKWSAKLNLSLTKKVCWQSFWYCIGFIVTIPCVMLNYYGDFRTSHGFGLLATASFFAPSQGFLNSLIYFHRASKKDSPFKLKRWISRCCWPAAQDKLPSTESRPSTGSTKPDSSQPYAATQSLPSETTDTAQPPLFTNDTNSRVDNSNIDHMVSATLTLENSNTASGGPEKNGDATDCPGESGEANGSPAEDVSASRSSENDSVLFSAAAAHWLQETAEYSGEQTYARPHANSAAIGRSFLRSTFARNRQSVR